ncbi:MAG: hypothetical protein FJ026_13900 [Chloroflexi bacterium]|nr:hypothetical protein [Chloroflexota bacterium]
MKAGIASATVVVLVITSLALAIYADSIPASWARVNENGFGNPDNQSVSCLVDFNNQLYAAATNYVTGAQLWRMQSDQTWTAVVSNGFGSARNGNIDHLLAFNGQLYAATENSTDGAEIWRSANGTDWTRVVPAGFWDPTNAEVSSFAVFGDKLYAATFSYTTTHGAQIWRSSTGNPSDWTRVVANGFGDPHNVGVLSFAVFNGYLYAGTNSLLWSDYSSTGSEVWRSSDGSNWRQVNADGFGAVYNTATSALTPFNGYLYASTTTSPGHGVEVWRCQACAGQDWVKVADNGFGKAETRGMSALEVFQGYLYLAVGNRITGMEVWRTANGTTWERVGADGLGNPHNWASYWDHALLAWQDRLYVGTWNIHGGGEVRMYLHQQVFLPVILRRR